MTMIVGCHFQEGVILLADSRVTWQLGRAPNIYQDTLQKILPLTRTMTIGFAGDVATAQTVIRSIQKRVAGNKKFSHISVLGPTLSRFAKHEYGRLIRQGKNPQSNSIILAGIHQRDKRTPSDIQLWTYEAPHYHSMSVKNGFVALGSGAQIVSEYLKANWDDLLAHPGELKGKADWLLTRLESELERLGDIYVGGLFQVLLIASNGICPLTYGRYSLDPDDQEDPIKMTIEKGVWTQANLRTGSMVSLQRPDRLTGPPSTSIKVKNFPGEAKTVKHYPESFLTYFVPCVGIDQGPGRATFLGVGNCFALGNFPASFNLLACFAIHPEPGKHQVTIRFGSDQSNMQSVYQDNIEATYPLQEIRHNPQVALYVPSAGDYFLELWIDTYRLARKPFVVRELLPELKTSVAPSQEIVRRQHASLMEDQMTRSDPELASGETILSYLVPCGRVEIGETEILFDCMGSVVFPPKFPAQMRYNLAIGFRVKPGTYRLRADLIESATREMMPVITTIIEALHEFREVQLQGNIILSFPRQGVYVLDMYLNERRIARSHFFADNVNVPMAYKLRQQDIDRIKGGETIMLVRDSVQESEPPSPS